MTAMGAGSRVAEAYIRLSRDDLRQTGTLEEKFALRADIARRLAEKFGLILPAENIFTERESGAKLSKRPIMLALMERVRQKRVPHLITPYVDRLLRGDKSDEQQIEDTFVRARVTLYHTEGDPIAFGPDYDPTLYEIKSFAARLQLRDTNNKRRQTDISRLDMAIRSRGYAPFGYRYLSAVRDEYRNIIKQADYEIVESEWPIVLEIFERIRTESLQSIAADLNARAVPCAGVGRLGDGGQQWYAATLNRIVRNPFYAGHMASRLRIVRGEVTPLDAVVLSSRAGIWPTVLTLPEWQDIQNLVSARLSPGRAAQGKYGSALLTGLLYCGNGFGMNANGDCYGCGCGEWRERHPGGKISRPRVEAWAWAIVDHVTTHVSDDALEALERTVETRKSSAATIRAERSAAGKKLQEAKAQVQDMILNAARYEQLFGLAEYETAAKKAADNQRQAQVKVDSLSTHEDIIDVAQLVAVTRNIRARGLNAATNGMDATALGALVRGFIVRIDLAPISTDTESRRYQHAEAFVTLPSWIDADRLPPIPPFPPSQSGFGSHRKP